jgi:DNA-directed RNA polymerase subunit K/omega
MRAEYDGEEPIEEPIEAELAETEPIDTEPNDPNEVPAIKTTEESDEESEITTNSDLEELESNSGTDENYESEEEAAINQSGQLMNTSISPPDSEVESDDEEDLQKIEEEQVLTYINRYHSECLVSNSDEVEALSKIIKINNVIIDPNHKTNPILSKYEKTKILGQRTKQLNSGCLPYISVPSNIIDNYLIAQMELKEKKIPVILRRPISSSHSEYWKLEDLEQIY